MRTGRDKAGTLYGIGVGPGDPELMTLKAVRLIEEADVVAVPDNGTGESLAFEIASGALPALVLKPLVKLAMPMVRDKAVLAECHEAAAKTVAQLLEAGKNVAFLTLGDPTIYSTYIYVHKKVLALGYEAEIVPGVASFCAVAARLGISLAENAEAIHVIPASYHGVDEGLSWPGTKVLMKAGRSFSALREKMQRRGMNAQMVQRCGLEGEKVFRSLDEADEESSYFSVIIARDGGPACEGPAKQ